jgi:hypothetical protein
MKSQEQLNKSVTEMHNEASNALHKMHEVSKKMKKKMNKD